MKENTTFLWLDDYRDPFIDYEGKFPKEYKNSYKVWVKNYDEFVDFIISFSLPDVISFDHDLADEHYTPSKYWNDYDASKAYQENQNYKEKTGMECAKWLVDYCIDNDEELPAYFVHSANPVGADNIRYLLNNFKTKYKK